MAVATPTMSGSNTRYVSPKRCSENSCVSEPTSSHSRVGEMRSTPSSTEMALVASNNSAAAPR
jgi:hypothetical protein